MESEDEISYEETIVEETEPQDEEVFKNPDEEEEELTTQGDIRTGEYSKICEYKVIEHRLDKHISADRISIFEYTALIAQRAAQIEKEPSYIYVELNNDEAIELEDIAKLELANQKCPLLVKRNVGTKIDHKNGIVHVYFEEKNPNYCELPR